MRAARYLGYAVVSVVLTAACSTGQTTSVPATSAPAGSKFGAPVITLETADPSPKWVRWDLASCSFKDAPAPYAGAYKLVVRGPGSFKGVVGWTPQDTVVDNLVLANKSFADTAAKAGIELKQISNNFPDNAQPIKTANDMVTLRPAAVLSMNVVAELQPRVFQIYKDACIPAVAMSNSPPDGIPFIAASWTDGGQAAAQAAIDYAKKAGWSPATVDVVVCVNAAFGKSDGPGLAVEVYKSTVVDGLPGVTKNHVYEIDCTPQQGGSTTDAAQRVMRDWLTAHPAATSILGFGGPDVYGNGIYNSLKASGRISQGFVSGIGLTAPIRKLLKDGETRYRSVDNGLFYYGPFGIGVAQDIIDGKPIPLRVVQPVKLVDSTNIQDVLRERGTTE